jgi:hypothetical protein
MKIFELILILPEIGFQPLLSKVTEIKKNNASKQSHPIGKN